MESQPEHQVYSAGQCKCPFQNEIERQLQEETGLQQSRGLILQKEFQKALKVKLDLLKTRKLQLIEL